jgi:hypothetical protein
MCELLINDNTCGCSHNTHKRLDRETEGHIFGLGVDWYTVKKLGGMSCLSGKFGNMVKSPHARVRLYSHATNLLAGEVGKSES